MKKTVQHCFLKSNFGNGILLNEKKESSVDSKNKNRFGFMAGFVLIVLMTFGISQTASAQGSFTWNGGGADNNWNTGANWGGSAPGSPQVYLNFAGSTRLTPNNNFSASSGGFQIYFKSGAGAFTLGGNLITFYNYSSNGPNIQNEGTAIQTINFPISHGNSGNSGVMNINGNGGGGPLVFGSTFTTPSSTITRTLQINNGNGTGTVTFNGAIGQGTGTGKLGVKKLGANSSAILAAANTYTGNTDINAGTLFINGSTSSSSPVIVLSGATLAGSGTAAGTVSLTGIVSPGGSSATTANLNTGAFTFNANSSYKFEVNNATGTAGNASGWDKITSTGAITCSATPITINLTSLSIANFNPATSYTWPIASGSTVTGFSTSNFTINTSNFTGATGTFSMTLTGGNTINVVYSPPSSGPAQPSAIVGSNSVCSGSSQTYSVTNDVNATNYIWTLPSGWSGTSATNSISVTVSTTGGTISVVAQNAQGDSVPSSLVVTVGAATAITTHPSTAGQSVCLGGAITPLTVAATGSALTYQWYSNTTQTNSGGTLISGATSASYTPSSAGPLYYYCVVGGSCAPTSIASNVSGAISVSGFPNDTTTYTITNGGNGGQGFSPWIYAVTGSGGTFTSGADIGNAWGLWANSGGLSSAIRPFAAPFAIGNTVSCAYDNGDVDTGQKVGIRLRNANNDILTEFRFIGGASVYSISDAVTSDTGVAFTMAGLSNVTFAYTGVNTYSISITRAGVTTVLTGRTFATAGGGQIPARIEFFNSNAGNGGTRDMYFNGLTIGYPRIFVQPSVSAQNVCLNGPSTTLSVAAYGSNLGYQWYSNPGAVLLSGQTASTFSPPTTTLGARTYYCVVSYTGSCGTTPNLTSASSGAVTVYGVPTATVSGAATVCANASSVVTFTGADGVAPYTFTYKINGGDDLTVTTTSGSSVTVPVVTSAAGSFEYSLVSVLSSTCSASASGSATVTVNTPTIFYTDADADTYGDLNNPVSSCDGSTPSGSVADATDCDDTDPSVHAKFSFYADADGDTFGFGPLVETCAVDEFTPPTGYTTDNTDCDDTDSRKTVTYPFYTDADGDNYGTGSLVQACAINDLTPPTGYSLDNTDCDDTDALKHATFAFFVDADGDTFGSTSSAMVCAVDAMSPPSGYSLNDTDCDDADALKTITYLYYVDADGDTYGSTASELLCTINATSPPAGYSVSNTDCDDADPLKYNLFSFYEDLDGDSYGAGAATSVCGQDSVTPPTGYSLDGTDCDDNDDTIYRNDTLYLDADGDGYDVGTMPPSCYGALPLGSTLTTLGSDCDDADDMVYRSAVLYVDVDGDGYTDGAGTLTCYGDQPAGTSLTTLGSDCDDSNPTIYRTANLYVDLDGDGYTDGNSSISCYGATLPEGTTLINNPSDCDDNDPTKHATFLFHPDVDQDGYGTGSPVSVCAVDQSLPPTGYSNDNSDCDDNDNSIYRTATLYTDADADGYDVGSAVVCYGATLPTGTSLTTLGTDCDDANAAIYQSATLYTDADSDTYTVGAGSTVCYGATLPAGTSLTASSTEDCDDTNATIYRSATLYTDVDADGYDVGSAVVCYGALPAGTSLTTLGSDCDDLNPAIHETQNLYADTDNDGFGAITATAVCAPVSCSSNTIAVNFRVDMTGQTIEAGGVHVAGNFATRGSTTITNDWAPDAPNSRLRAIGNNIYELTVLFPATSAGSVLEFKFLRNNAWNGNGNEYSEQTIDGACSASGNRLFTLPTNYVNWNAAYNQCPTVQKFLCDNTDCDDSNTAIHATYSFYADADGDTYGTGSLVSVCAVDATTPPTGYSLNDTDCDDTNVSIYRSATLYTDADNDTYTVGSGSTVCYGATLPTGTALEASLTEDCDDADVFIYRSATLYTDADNDTYTVGSGSTVCYGATLPTGTALEASLTEDCDDANNEIYRSATLYTDADNDGYDVGSAVVCYGATQPAGTSLTTLGSDCDDTNDALQQTFGFYADADGDTYGAGSQVQVCALSATEAPAGYSLNDSDCDDENSNIYQFATFYVDADGDTYGSNATASVCSGLTTPAGYSTNNLDCDDTNAALNPTNPCSAGSVVNLTLFVESYYTGGSTMNSVKLNQDYESPADEVEDLTVELHDASDYSLVDTAIGTLKTDGTLSVTFNTAAAGSYYIAVLGSNIIQTWSATPQAVGTTPLTYDFSSAASQSYEDNMREIEPGVFALYSGDVNQDQVIDNADTDPIYPDIDNSNFGVLATDLNGDGVVDNADLDNLYNNLDNSIYAHYPF